MAEAQTGGVQKAASAARKVYQGVKLAKAIAAGAAGPVGIAAAVWDNRDLIKKLLIINLCFWILVALIVYYFVTNLPAAIFGSGNNEYKDIGTINAIYANVEDMGNATRQEIVSEHSGILKKVQDEISQREQAEAAAAAAAARAGGQAVVHTFKISDTFTSVGDDALYLAISAYSVKYGDDQNTPSSEFDSKIQGALAACFSYTTSESGNVITYTIKYDPQKITDAFGLNAAQITAAKKKAASLQTFMETGSLSDTGAAGSGGNSVSSAGDGNAIVAYAKQFLGVPYVIDGESPYGFDCSGFTAYIYQNAAGIALPHSAIGQSTMGTYIDRNSLEPGDLIFFATEGGNTITHCGIYIGNDQFIAANTGSANSVSIESLLDSYWVPKYVTARRLLSTSSGLIEFIENHEGYYSAAYRGVDSWNLTIGYGHVIVDGDGLSASSVLSQPQAEALLKSDLGLYEDSVNKEFAGYSLNQHQHDALVDLAYGLGAWCWSECPTLTSDIKSGASADQLKADFLALDHSGGNEVQGLRDRRYDDWFLFEYGSYDIVSYGQNVG